MPGFRMTEVMTGQHEFAHGQGPEGERFMEFVVDWGTRDLKAWLDPSNACFMFNELSGVVTIEGLCDNSPCSGSLELLYFTEASIRYTFYFQTYDMLYKYVGQKTNIKPWNLPWSHTTCQGILTRLDTGKVVSTSVTHFRLRTIPAFLRSFRFLK